MTQLNVDGAVVDLDSGLPNWDFSAYRGDERFPLEKRLAVLDALARLQLERVRVVRAMERGQGIAARILGRGTQGINVAMARSAKTWRTLESLRNSGTIAQLGVSLPNNAFLVAAGLQMTSVWHYAGLDPDVRMVLSCEDASAYFFGYAPVQMKIVDRREVLLDGPRLRGEPTVIAVRDTACMDAARDYWSAVTTTTYPCVAEAASLDDFSPRQRHVVALMLVSTTDEEIAGRLGVSLRTVRTEIAAVLRLLEAPTRFVAGTRLRERLGVQAPTHDG